MNCRTKGGKANQSTHARSCQVVVWEQVQFCVMGERLRSVSKIAIVLWGMLGIGGAWADSFRADVEPLIRDSCIACHDSDTETGLNFETLPDDLSDAHAMGTWQRVFDQATSGRMPPKSEPRPESGPLRTALASLEGSLIQASLESQKQGRVPARRLTKLELAHTLQDLLHIDVDPTRSVPDEIASGGFDLVGAHQRISAVHMEGYLAAADEALDRAIQLGPNPYLDYGDLADHNFAFLEPWHDKPLNLGGSLTRKLRFSNGYVLFRDIDYLTAFTHQIRTTGIHRLSATVAAYQSDEPVTVKFIVKDPTGGARLAKAVDLLPGEPRTIMVETLLRPGDTPYLTFDDRVQGSRNIFLSGGSRTYRGPGLAIRSQRVEGPLTESWPPPSTRRLLGDSDWRSAGIEEIRLAARRLAPRVFRRPVPDSEIEGFVRLAGPVLAEGRTAVEGLKVTLRAMLGSPTFLMFAGSPGQLDDHALASRLSYFLWRSMPDEELLSLADQGQLSDPSTLAAQVERLLADQKSKRWVKDFVGQWLRLNQINATSPDDGLYPEFDELLGDALPKETEHYFASLVDDNQSVRMLIDSDFTFVNRRLAEHYGMKGVAGQHFRRVSIPDNSPRGGVLTQAAILKTTANGTTTSPVTRGNFVLTNFLGTPPPPPPPSVGSIEPDTRGQTTIREILSAHRDTESCNRCHREIDPPGFALESFDPIGGFRLNYRATGGEQTYGGFTTKLPPKQGPPVDSSGVMSDGQSFADIHGFKAMLLADTDQVARHFISQLLVFSTGGEIEFADRKVIDEIIDQTQADDYPVRDLIHAVVQSRLFRNL